MVGLEAVAVPTHDASFLLIKKKVQQKATPSKQNIQLTRKSK
jgi:hypothetical protein